MKNTSETNVLQRQFSLIRDRQSVLDDIYASGNLRLMFDSWNEEQQTRFLDICSGARGVKMLYDSFFKEIFNPDTVPERLESLLSLILGQRIKILKVLPNESSRIADEGSLLIMDIIVEMLDGSIANVECQKIGYRFPGQRAACYSADLLMRQYRRMKKERGKAFTYRDIRKVYTVIFYEQSPPGFYEFPDHYIHRFRQRSDTGMELELLQEFVLIPLDIFFKFHHNKGIRTELEGWLTFLGSDRPEDIIALVGRYPYFKALYEDIYTLCLNTEKVIQMFSKELLELDRNTVQYMIDEMQEEIDGMQVQIETMKTEHDAAIADKDAAIAKKDVAIAEKDAELDSLRKRIRELEA